MIFALRSLKIMIMDNKDDKALKESSATAAIKRGEEAIEDNKKLNEKGKNDEEINKEEKSDAEKWRNEG